MNTQLRAVDAEQPAYDIRSLEQVVADGLSGIESSARMMMSFAGCALILAAAGIFAVMAYSVTQRTMKSEYAWRWERGVSTCSGWWLEEH